MMFSVITCCIRQQIAKLFARMIFWFCKVRWYLTRKHRTNTFSTTLPGCIWGITTFFNPCGYTAIMANYHVFRKSLQKQGLPLITVELAFGNDPFFFHKEDADILIQRRGGDVLWQKERLLNIALEYLPDNCDKVVWLDSDVLFENGDWVEQTSKNLEQYMVVQPFSAIIRLPHGVTRCDWQTCHRGTGEKELFHSFGYSMVHYGKIAARFFHSRGMTGGAMAMRRSLLHKYKFYDADITGAGDLIMAQAFCGNTTYERLAMMSVAQKMHVQQWAQDITEGTQCSVHYTQGIAYHLWHGEKKNRRYTQRHVATKSANFDPEKDIIIDAISGAWCWNSTKPALHNASIQYFAKRKEDGESPLTESRSFTS